MKVMVELAPESQRNGSSGPTGIERRKNLGDADVEKANRRTALWEGAQRSGVKTQRDMGSREEFFPSAASGMFTVDDSRRGGSA